MFAAFVQ
ncbi:hypothetical protein D031_2108A, partial [Vibrio parahaemolyticus VP-48]